MMQVHEKKAHEKTCAMDHEEETATTKAMVAATGPVNGRGRRQAKAHPVRVIGTGGPESRFPNATTYK